MPYLKTTSPDGGTEVGIVHGVIHTPTGQVYMQYQGQSSALKAGIVYEVMTDYGIQLMAGVCTADPPETQEKPEGENVVTFPPGAGGEG